MVLRVSEAKRPEYWFPGKLIITLAGVGEPSVHYLSRPFARIGSHPESDVVLPGRVMPRRCYYLHASRDGIHWLRLWHAESAATPLRGTIASGESVSIGPIQITARLEVESDAPAAAAKIEHLEPSYPVLSVSIHGRKAEPYPLKHRLTPVGREDPSELQMESKYVSACQCVLAWENGALWAIDLFSGNPTSVHGHRIEAAPVGIGRSIVAGDCRIVYQTQPLSMRPG